MDDKQKRTLLLGAVVVGGLFLATSNPTDPGPDANGPPNHPAPVKPDPVKPKPRKPDPQPDPIKP